MEYKIHLYHGDGKGKTTCSTGLAVRAIGSGMNVVFVQFLKDGSSSEISVLKNLPNLKYFAISEHKKFWFAMNEEERAVSRENNNELFKTAISNIKENTLVVFDEMIGSIAMGAIDETMVMDFLKSKTECEIVMTGRNPSEELVKIADYVSEIKKIKHPYDEGVTSRKGIEF